MMKKKNIKYTSRIVLGLLTIFCGLVTWAALIPKLTEGLSPCEFSENGFGKYIILELKQRFDSLGDNDKMKIIEELSISTKANQQWAEVKRRSMNKKTEEYDKH